jgi:hypothetical protein
MKTALIAFFVGFIMLLTAPAGAASKRSQNKQLEIALSKYSSAIRWSEFEMAWGYVEPKYREENPLSDLEKERFKQIQISGYEVKSRDTMEDGSVEQLVEIRLINRNTQADRSVIDTQIWRWDPKAKRWWLTTGLPNFTAKSW